MPGPGISLPEHPARCMDHGDRDADKSLSFLHVGFRYKRQARCPAHDLFRWWEHPSPVCRLKDPDGLAAPVLDGGENRSGKTMSLVQQVSQTARKRNTEITATVVNPSVTPMAMVI